MDGRRGKRTLLPLLAASLWMLSVCLEVIAATQIRNPNDDPAFGDAMPGELFGSSMAVDGTTAAIGSTRAVRIFRKQDGAWVLEAKLTDPDPSSYHSFGRSVALDGDTLVVGAPSIAGSVHVFQRNGAAWVHTQALPSTEPTPDDSFGDEVALDGDWLAVGAPRAKASGFERAGSVTLYARGPQGWTLRQTIPTPSPSHDTQFGAALAFAGDELVIGAYGESRQAGAAYAYVRDDAGTWTMRQRLVGSDIVQGDAFGMSLAAGDDRLLVGAPAFGQDRSGSVVEWRRLGGQWFESNTLRPTSQPDVVSFGRRLAHAGGGAWFVGAERRPFAGVTGVELFTYDVVNDALAPSAQSSVPFLSETAYGLHSLATDGTNAFLGLPFRHAPPWSDAGEVLVVDPDGRQISINNGTTAAQEYFGSAVVANTRWLLVGAPWERRNSRGSGAVFAYDPADFDSTPATVVIDVDGDDRAEFGAALALSGDTLIVGSPRQDTGTVQAYEYDGAHWQQTERWSSPNPAMLFGQILAADAATLVVGAPYEENEADDAGGAAYVYERTGKAWSPPTRLSAANPAPKEWLGNSVAVDDGLIAIGSGVYEIGDTGLPFPVDAFVRVFEKGASAWSEVALLVRPESTAPAGQFGFEVAVAGETIFVSAAQPREVHVFERHAGQWVHVQRLDAPATSTGGFGDRIRVIDGELWIAASDHDPTQRGSLHRFTYSENAWRLVQSMHTTSSETYQNFAGDFAVESGLAFIGAPWSDAPATRLHDTGRVDVEAVNLFGGGFEE